MYPPGLCPGLTLLSRTTEVGRGVLGQCWLVKAVFELELVGPPEVAASVPHEGLEGCGAREEGEAEEGERKEGLAGLVGTELGVC